MSEVMRSLHYKMEQQQRRQRKQVRTNGRTLQGQSLVEFALVLMVFMLVTVGLLDGLRVIFYYSQIQEAAREGARWGAVQVNRATVVGGASTVGGTFSDVGNKPNITYCNNPGLYSCPNSGRSSLTDHESSGTGYYPTTIVGAVTQATNAVDLSTAAISITTGITSTGTIEDPGQTNDLITNLPVTVTVQYPFKPILGMVFGGVTINLQGKSAMLHE